MVGGFVFKSGERDQSSLHFFERDACISTPFLIDLDARFGTVQELFSS